jgi:hypothetical protein
MITQKLKQALHVPEVALYEVKLVSMMPNNVNPITAATSPSK